MEGSWDIYRDGARWRSPAWQARAILGVPGALTVGFQLGVLEGIDIGKYHEYPFTYA